MKKRMYMNQKLINSKTFNIGVDVAYKIFIDNIELVVKPTQIRRLSGSEPGGGRCRQVQGARTERRGV